MFDLSDIQAWEKYVDAAKVSKHHGHKKHYFDPRKDALIRHRHRCGWTGFNESTYARKKVQKQFKMRMKELLHQENYYNPVPHEYKTYGWETW